MNAPGRTALGEALHKCSVGWVTVKVTKADWLANAVLVALTLTALGMGTAAGAWYRPRALTVPLTASPPGTPFTAQLTVGTASGT